MSPSLAYCGPDWFAITLSPRLFCVWSSICSPCIDMLSALIGDNCASDVPLGISRSAIDATVWREAAVRWLLCRGTSVIILVAVVLIGVIRTREIVCTRRHLALARIIQISILVSYLPFHHPKLPPCFDSVTSQRLGRALVGLERFGLAPTEVVGVHEQGGELLVFPRLQIGIGELGELGEDASGAATAHFHRQQVDHRIPVLAPQGHAVVRGPLSGKAR